MKATARTNGSLLMLESVKRSGPSGKSERERERARECERERERERERARARVSDQHKSPHTLMAKVYV